jgi:hypothetical protein
MTDRTIGKLPTTAINPVYAVQERSLAVGTHNRQVFIMDFPPGVLISSDTWTVEGKGRETFKLPGAQ